MHIMNHANNANPTNKYHLSYSTVYEDVYEPSYGTSFIFCDEDEEEETSLSLRNKYNYLPAALPIGKNDK